MHKNFLLVAAIALLAAAVTYLGLVGHQWSKRPDLPAENTANMVAR